MPPRCDGKTTVGGRVSRGAGRARRSRATGPPPPAPVRVPSVPVARAFEPTAAARAVRARVYALHARSCGARAPVVRRRGSPSPDETVFISFSARKRQATASLPPPPPARLARATTTRRGTPGDLVRVCVCVRSVVVVNASHTIYGPDTAASTEPRRRLLFYVIDNMNIL